MFIRPFRLILMVAANHNDVEQTIDLSERNHGSSQSSCDSEKPLHPLNVNLGESIHLSSQPPNVMGPGC